MFPKAETLVGCLRLKVDWSLKEVNIYTKPSPFHQPSICFMDPQVQAFLRSMKRWINVKTTKNWRLPIEAKSVITPRKFNIAPKKRQSQKQTHLPTIIFSGAMLNFGGVVVSGNFHGNKEQKLSGLEYQYSSHSSVDGFNPYEHMCQGLNNLYWGWSHHH